MTMIESAKRNLKLGSLLTFVGINLRFATGNIIHALIYFNFLQPGSSEHRYEVHVPNPPDMCGDGVMAIVFAFAYFVVKSIPVKKAVCEISDNLQRPDDQDMECLRHLIHWTKKFVFISIIGFSLYFFSKYFLSAGIETFLEENEESRIPFVLNISNYLIRLCSVFIFVYAYCKYLSLNKGIAITLYIFFFIRFLFATNVLGFITKHDLYTAASLLDFLTAIIITYSVISIFIGVKDDVTFEIC
ncbi:MAG: hypothetical protein Q6358_02145 [Candidatus Brocadiales bacterium]|nr:hypothetical protein [Candidatus Brocadiales bacterium]